LYLTLYPQEPTNASQLKVASVIPGELRLFTGAVQGVKVVNVSKEDHDEAELLSLEHQSCTII